MSHEMCSANIHLANDGNGYRDVDVYVKEGDAEWLFRIYKELDSGNIVRCQPRYAENADSAFGDEGMKAPGLEVLSAIEKVFGQVIQMLNDPAIKVALVPADK